MLMTATSLKFNPFHNIIHIKQTGRSLSEVFNQKTTLWLHNQGQTQQMSTRQRFYLLVVIYCFLGVFNPCC